MPRIVSFFSEGDGTITPPEDVRILCTPQGTSERSIPDIDWTGTIVIFGEIIAIDHAGPGAASDDNFVKMTTISYQSQS